MFRRLLTGPLGQGIMSRCGRSAAPGRPARALARAEDQTWERSLPAYLSLSSAMGSAL